MTQVELFKNSLQGCLWIHADDTDEPWPFKGVSPTRVRSSAFPLTDEQVWAAKKVSLTSSSGKGFVIWVRGMDVDRVPSEWERTADFITQNRGGVLSCSKSRDLGVDQFLDLLIPQVRPKA